MRQQIENTIPVLSVRSIDQSIAFYRELLGYEVEWNAGSVCSIVRDGCPIMLQAKGDPEPGTVWIGMVDDSLYATILNAGATVLQPPTRRSWAYEMKVADPDGNVLWLGADPKD
jgi:catechol 2,3-dioxygenase-like lactoylglutathione lyase family enzyme